MTTQEASTKPQVAIMNAVHDLPVLVARDAGFFKDEGLDLEGPHLVVTLNGTRTVDVLDHKLSRGPIALQYGAGVVKFRKVEIKPL